MSRQSHSRSLSPLIAHLCFVLSSGLVLMLLFTLLRGMLLLHNRELATDVTLSDLGEAFFNGLRFDLRLAIYICVPLFIALLYRRLMLARLWQRLWLTLCASLTLFLGALELDFYREFQQRLNSLVFQYFQEDTHTVLSMIWNGYPVMRYLIAWVLVTLLLWFIFRWLDRTFRAHDLENRDAIPRVAVFALCLVLSVLGARGTLKQGPPLRWGDAYTTQSTFTNHLGLNGTLSLINAAKNYFSSHRQNAWKPDMPEQEALNTLRSMLLPQEQLIDADQAAIRRIYTPDEGKRLPITNVVVILMESFAAHSVGVISDRQGITPYFDQLSKEGLLFTRFFSNGTHTHQGMFATMGCFPNLPAYEYLMRMPEGSNQFSGLPQQLSARDYSDVYVYNGNFQWDNQAGFFSNQGMTRFIGREDFVNPVYMDSTWGVSDQDTFDRAAEELAKMPADKPFYALIQTLSNHTPYALPNPLPVQPVTGYGSLDQHLTAMRYADWALGRFFEEAKKQPYYKNTLFVVLGDHGFATNESLTELNIIRFRVPLLLIAPGIQEKFGATRDTVGSQVDVVPTIMGRLGGRIQHQCWGRDLLELPPGDTGVAVVKPSGSDQTVGIFRDDHLLVESQGMPPVLYRYQLGKTNRVEKLEDPDIAQTLRRQMHAYIQEATRSLQENTTGISARE